tara:strand:+ start:433 stop:786 length:354 start_codon:yes stop_codon:yes gene_type:complete
MFLLITILSCSTTEFPKNYALYKRDKNLNYPDEDLKIVLVNDTTGVFTNSKESFETLSQRFYFEKVNNEYLVVDNVSPIDDSSISLNKGDTIVVYKKRLHFFYHGNQKYLLSFKRSK